jgi:haloalkane dehalogenase
MSSRWPEFPFQYQTLTLDGHGLRYLEEGPRDAPPVVMLHGNPTWAFYYRRLVAALSGEYRVIVPDHMGMGMSDRPPEGKYDYSLKRRIEDVGQLLAHLKIDREVTLVLHDWGGMIGMGYAADHVSRIGRIVLFNTGAFHLPPDKQMPWQLNLARNRLLGPLLVRGLNAFSRGAVKNCVVRRPLSAEVRRAYLAPYDSWAHRRAVHRFVLDIPLKPDDAGYEQVSHIENALPAFRNTPTLICWGMRDFVFDHHFLEQWEQHLPQAEIHRYEDAGHFVLEDAAGEIAPLVQDFLARHPLDAATRTPTA